MKKIIFLIIMYFFAILPAKAYDDSFWSNEIINDDSIKLIQTERRYAWYKEETIYSNDYYIEAQNLSEYPNKVPNDYIETPFTNWDDSFFPESLPNRTIESRVVNKYRELRPIRYIYFTNIIGGFTTFNISELKILINNIPINYGVECNNCSLNFNSNISNGIIDESNVYINNGGNLRIDLNNYYSVGQVRIELYMKDTVPNTKKCNISFNEGPTVDDRSYVYNTFASYVVSDNLSSPQKYLIIPDNDWHINPIYNDWIYIDGFMNATYYRQMVVAVERRYKDIKYRYTGIKRLYLDDYYSNVEDNSYIKDEDNYKDYYLYKKNEEVVTENTNNIDQNLSKPVEEPSKTKTSKEENNANASFAEVDLRDDSSNTANIKKESKRVLSRHNNDSNSKYIGSYIGICLVGLLSSLIALVLIKKCRMN